jgi:plasmid stabilization system protein ParE
VIIEISPRARRQIQAARRWWLQNRDKAPELFDDELDRVQELLARMPYAGKPAHTRHGPARRLTIDRIRYYLYYRVLEDSVRLISLWHTSRRPPRL